MPHCAYYSEPNVGAAYLSSFYAPEAIDVSALDAECVSYKVVQLDQLDSLTRLAYKGS